MSGDKQDFTAPGIIEAPAATGQEPTHKSVRKPARGLPAGIWALGFVSLFMDISSEMIHALLPIYLTTGLGASALAVGLIEGVAQAIAAMTKVFSGALSDRIGRRKGLAALGYGLAALTKPIFPLAPTLGWVVAARFIDRVGKGIRGAPRDALIADLAPAGLRGAAFGLRKSLDTAGAFIGPLVAIGLMWLFADDFQSVFWVAVVPAFLSLGLILFVVREPARPQGLRQVRNPLARAELRQLGRLYWWVVVVATLFTLARFSEAFLVLHAHDQGVPTTLVPLVFVGMNAVYALSAYPVGVLSDRIGPMRLLVAGLALLIAADLTLALSQGIAGLALGILLWGLHLGFTQGLLAALVAGAVPAELRGTGFGMFNLITGLALLVASVLAGAIWTAAGAPWTFFTGAGFALASLVCLVPLRHLLAHRPHPAA
ncbi:MFS transporter [Celeribacter neptunius]|uniref:Predicted arabinose efflux permease, MFS family n=1 Tax=Celeribacter neptunius TaxID=588602 RepID=A0A1I3IM90_9RHOB|nr:MFS transporter [Celeribacter neptunius]SFI48903.1 Predicted arabinose efflux permease, MFS family [Celeribacter neptunius]